MTFDDAINLLNKHLAKLRTWDNDFDAWIETSVEVVHETFGLLSQQHSSITSLKADYKIARISDKSAELIARFSKRASQQFAAMIELMQDRKKQAITESENARFAKEQQQKEVERQEALKRESTSQPKITPLPTEPRKSALRKYLESFSKVNGAAWGTIITVAVTCIGGAYVLGKDNGSAKFDKEKIELSQDNNVLKKNIGILHKQLILARDSVTDYTDTVRELKLQLSAIK